MAEAVYLLCAIASVACALLLYRGYHASRQRLLFWSCLCFIGLALNNLVLFLDFIMLPTWNMGVVRTALALGAMTVLVYGLIWDVK